MPASNLVRWVWLVVCAWLGWLLPSSAHAQDAEPETNGRVVIASDVRAAAFVERVASEVRATGLQVVVVAFDGPLHEQARDHGAVAAIRLLPSRKGVEVWMTPELTGRPLLRQVIADEAPGGPDQALVALQTAELLRTSLLFGPNSVTPASPRAEASVAAPPAGNSPSVVESAPPQRAPEPEPETQAAGSVQLALGPWLTTGPTTHAVQLWFSAGLALGSHGFAALDVSLPVSRAQIRGPEGSASVAATHLALNWGLEWKAPDEPWFVSGALGGGVLHLAVEGSAAEPLLDTSTSKLTAVGYLRGDAGYEVTQLLRLGLRVAAGACAHEVTVQFAGNEAARWGPGFVALLGMASLQWR